MVSVGQLLRNGILVLLTAAGVGVIIAIDRHREDAAARNSLRFAWGFLLAAGMWVAGWVLTRLPDHLPTWEMEARLARLIVRVLPLVGSILRSLGYVGMPATWLAFSLTSPAYDRRARFDIVQWLMLVPAALALFAVVRDSLLWAGGQYASIPYRYVWLMRALVLLTRVYVLAALAGGFVARLWRRSGSRTAA